MAFIIVAAGPVTASRMRTFAAGPVLACVAAMAVVLMGGCVALGYRLAQEDARAVGPSQDLDATRPARAEVVRRIGELSGKLVRLEIEAAELAKRLRIAPTGKQAVASKPVTENDAGPRGGPLLPVDEDAPLDPLAVHAHGDGEGVTLSELEAGIDDLAVTFERMSGLAVARDLDTMAYPSRMPVPNQLARISSGFGVRHDPFTGRLARHAGLDIPAAHGTAILASGGGRVVAAGLRGPYGKAVVIDHGDGLQTLYGHCSTLYVREGDLVMPQQKIAAVGSTGRSTGPHLHFEVIRDGARVAPGEVLATVLARNPS